MFSYDNKLGIEVKKVNLYVWKVICIFIVDIFYHDWTYFEFEIDFEYII